MKHTHSIRLAAVALSMALLSLLLASCADTRYTITPSAFTYQSASVPNPMKGFAGFYEKAERDQQRGREPAPYVSLEYVGIPFSEIYQMENGQGRLNKDYLDPMLQSIAERGNNAILRIYMLYPGYNNAECNGLFIPDELYEQLKADGDLYSNSYQKYALEYPDFNNEKLIGCMLDFIEQFGAAYDNNPVIAVIQMGLYGSWGEWNLSGCDRQSCAMTDENLSRIIKAYTEAFPHTKLMGRNPSLGEAHSYDIGYHDDNFLFNSSDFHTKNADWKNKMKQVDPSYATIQQFYDFMDGEYGAYQPIWDKWQTQMFGGELSGMIYNDPFGPLWSGTEREAFDYCIRQFHMSWLMGVGRDGIPEQDTPEFNEYLTVNSSFGYEIGITSVESKDRTGKIITHFTNYGIAPFYYDWTPEYWLTDADGQTVYTYQDTSFRLSELLPDESLSSTFFLPDNMEEGDYTLLMRFINPSESISENAKPLILANNYSRDGGVYQLATLTAK